MAHTALPELPAKPQDLIAYLAKQPDVPLSDQLKPFDAYESRLREIFAQQPNHPCLEDPLVNLLSVYAGHEHAVKVRARKLDAETAQQRENYILALKPEQRRENGTQAIVPSLKEFQSNFNLFTESSLSHLDWSNVVAAGGSVMTSLLPPPTEYVGSKCAMRRWYHEELAPESDIDLFLYGLTEEAAFEKIKQIERAIRDSVLGDTTTVRTRNTITIVSRYPVRHVQIILRIYKSISEILAGFDIDSACVAYNGSHVYMSPRALVAFMSQVNTVDLSRCSPSYEHRLFKYSQRGFEVFWASLDRSRVNPAIFDHTAARASGLARLLVLEKSSKDEARSAYMAQRRGERGCRVEHSCQGHGVELTANIKPGDSKPMPEWQDDYDEIGSLAGYHTMKIPYGPHWHAQRVEKLVFANDLLLNTEWNPSEHGRKHLHRHPAFVGSVQHVLEDCCLSCPKVASSEVASEADKRYVSGRVSFSADDTGRQTVGSFNPSTEGNWCHPAYFSEEESFFQAVVDNNVDFVRDSCSQDKTWIDRRDLVGRTALHLAVMTSSTQVCLYLIEKGANLNAWTSDGKTALHLAASRGHAGMVRAILDKSRNDKARDEQEKRQSNPCILDEDAQLKQAVIDQSDDDEADTILVNIRCQAEKEHKPDAHDKKERQTEDAQAPHVYDGVNVLSREHNASPLHYAIAGGHVHIVVDLVHRFGADVTLPVKPSPGVDEDFGLLTTLELASRLPQDKANAMTSLLLSLGASPLQTDASGVSTLHRIVSAKAGTVETILDTEHQAALQKATGQVLLGELPNWCSQTLLHVAIYNKDLTTARMLLSKGAPVELDPDTLLEPFLEKFGKLPRIGRHNTKHIKRNLWRITQQPVIWAIIKGLPSLARDLIERGASPNSLMPMAEITNEKAKITIDESLTVLDLVRERIRIQHKALQTAQEGPEAPQELQHDSYYLDPYEKNSYRSWAARSLLQEKKQRSESAYQDYCREKSQWAVSPGITSLKRCIRQWETLEVFLVASGAKTSVELLSDSESERAYVQDTAAQKPASPKPFEIKFTFRHLHWSVPEQRQTAYLKLFEAAWQGDVEKIKFLIGSCKGAATKHVPLCLTVTDADGFSPFSIAMLRGEHAVAEAILDMLTTANQSGRCKDARSVLEAGVSASRLFQIFTPDGRPAADTSDTPAGIDLGMYPSEMCRKSAHRLDQAARRELRESWAFSWDAPRLTLVEYSLYTRDQSLFSFMNSMWLKYCDSSPSIEKTSIREQRMAMRLGRRDMLAEMISRRGTVLALDSLVESVCAECDELQKKDNYEGLLVHGERRRDWALAVKNRNGNAYLKGSAACRATPILEAARNGSIDTVEWFLSKDPARCYHEYAEAVRHQQPLDLQPFVHQFLTSRLDLVIHCALLTTHSDRRLALLQHLLERVPQFINKKSPQCGFSPLQIAFALRDADAAKLLIAAGADQMARDKTGRNILHSLLVPFNKMDHRRKSIKPLLKLVDPRIKDNLIVGTCDVDGGLLTPIAYWFKHQGKYWLEYYRHDPWRVPEGRHLLNLWLQYSGGVELVMLDGKGSTPLHDAVTSSMAAFAEVLLLSDPALVWREDSEGRTPLDLAHGKDLSWKLGGAGPVYFRTHDFSDSVELMECMQQDWMIDATWHTDTESCSEGGDNAMLNRSIWDMDPFMSWDEYQQSVRRNMVQLCEAVAHHTSYQHNRRCLITSAEIQVLSDWKSHCKRLGFRFWREHLRDDGLERNERLIDEVADMYPHAVEAMRKLANLEDEAKEMSQSL